MVFWQIIADARNKHNPCQASLKLLLSRCAFWGTAGEDYTRLRNSNRRLRFFTNSEPRPSCCFLAKTAPQSFNIVAIKIMPGVIAGPVPCLIPLFKPDFTQGVSLRPSLSLLETQDLSWVEFDRGLSRLRVDVSALYTNTFVVKAHRKCQARRLVSCSDQFR
jgi:hypothetical protein